MIISIDEKNIIIDDELFDLINSYKWFINKDGYVYRSAINNQEKRKYGSTVLLHRFIMKVDKNDGIIDHIDNNPLNNCKNNLRKCTAAENSYNHKKYKNNTSGYKGVNYVREKRKKKNGETYIKEYWKVTITYKGKQYTKKFIYNEENLIKAVMYYNEKAKELFGEFACLNTIL